MRLIAAVALCLVLSACDWFGGGEEDDDRTSSGEVLEGTISDAMLPLDTVRSQPPLAKVTGKPGEDGAEPDEEAADEAGEGEEPAEEPAAEAEEN